MTPERPELSVAERKALAEREVASADFRATLTERLAFNDERTVTYDDLAVEVRQLGELLKDGEFAYIEVEMSDAPGSDGTKLDKVSMLVPDSETGDYRDGATLYEADLPFGDVRKFELRHNLSPAEKQRIEERPANATATAVMTGSTIQLMRQEILMDKPEGYEGEPVNAAEIRKLLERFPG